MNDVDLTKPVTSSAARSPSGVLRALFLGLGGLGFWPLFFVLFSGTPTCMGFEEPTLATLEACPDVARALGTPIRRSWMGMSCGNAETEGNFGHASWRFPVAGPNGSGTVEVVAEMRGGPWNLYSATVETEAGTFEAVSCARNAGATPGLAAPTITAQRITATVLAAMGPAPAPTGARCELEIGPGAGPFPCRATLTCGGRTIYGGGTAGYLQCLPDATGHLILMDGEPSGESGDPRVAIPLASGSGVVSDVSEGGPWTLTLSFPPP